LTLAAAGVSVAPRKPTKERALRPVLLAFTLVAALTQLPYAVAGLRPPPGLAFIGTFYYPDDVYNYMSYAQQGEDGALVFRNKVVAAPHPPALVNLEWLGVGWLSAALGGGRLFVAWRILALVAGFGFVLAADRALAAAGLPASHRLPALVLVSTGAGLGGILFLAGRELNRCYDLYAGLFPALELLANPHFVTGTALLVFALVAFARSRTIAGVLLGSALALVRPYDLVLLVGIVSLSTLFVARGWAALRPLLPLLGFLPAVLYLYWLFYENPAFAFYAQTPYAFPGLADLAWALGPAALLAVLASLGRREAAAGGPERRMRAQLVAWIACALAVVLLRPVGFSLQFLVGVGFPLLALGAIGLARFRPAVTLVTALAFATTLLIAVRFLLGPGPYWFMPRERMLVVERLREHCRSGDRVFAPEDIGLFAFGTTRCQAFVSHAIAPGYPERRAKLEAFGSMSSEARAALLEDASITLLVLPGDEGPRPLSWLPHGTAFRRVATAGAGPAGFSLYRREPAARPQLPSP
jgi:hypothetical protein